MPNIALFIVVACVLYAGNVSTGPIPRTNTVLPRDAASIFLGTSRFPPPEVAIASKIDAISSRDLISSDMNLHGHQASESVERRDPIFIGLAVRSPPGSPSPHLTLQGDDPEGILTINLEELDTASLPPTLPNPDPETIRMIHRLKDLKTKASSHQKRALYFFKEAFDLTHDFLFSLGAQSVAQKTHPEVKLLITTALAIKIREDRDRASDDQTSDSPEEVTEAALKLLEVAKNDSMENKKLTSDQVESMVTTFTKRIESLEQKRKAEMAELDDLRAEQMNLDVQLWKHLTQALRPGDPTYDKALVQRTKTAEFAKKHLRYNSLPKAHAAAENLLGELGETLETDGELARNLGKKRKADEASRSGGPSGKHMKE